MADYTNRIDSGPTPHSLQAIAKSTAEGFAGVVQALGALQGQLEALSDRVGKLEGQLKVQRTLSQGRKRK